MGDERLGDRLGGYPLERDDFRQLGVPVRYDEEELVAAWRLNELAEQVDGDLFERSFSGEKLQRRRVFSELDAIPRAGNAVANNAVGVHCHGGPVEVHPQFLIQLAATGVSG